ncbi:hypothetical protein HMPREF9120_02329 [Neisseria sp. oral taxon 020 str. F0370]|nr:hypothetical protein HMPREF9120_02329 [Neisseria sp. oral taxon 020 str. F0370]
MVLSFVGRGGRQYSRAFRRPQRAWRKSVGERPSETFAAPRRRVPFPPENAVFMRVGTQTAADNARLLRLRKLFCRSV